jgi:STE24 endopeptidase
MPTPDAARIKSYNRLKLSLSLSETALAFAVLAGLILAGWSGRIADFALSATSNPYIALLLFAAIVGLIEAVFSFPLGFYSGFIVEHRYGLSNQTIGAWLREELKGTLVGIVLGTPILLAFYFFLRQFGSLWWLPVAVVLFLFSVLLARLAPTLLFPIFYKFEPLPGSPLKERILNLAARVGMRVEGIFRFNLSKNTKKANAAFAGIGRSKRILLADTLLDRFEEDEIETVVAHELGHFKFGHIRLAILAGFLTIFVGLYLTSVLYARSLPWFGFSRLDDLAALPLLALWLGLYGLLTSPIQNALSRRFEWQADRFAVELTGKAEAFAAALRKLSEQNLSDPDPHPLVEWLFYSHPAISKRVAAVLAIGQHDENSTSEVRPAVTAGG